MFKRFNGLVSHNQSTLPSRPPRHTPKENTHINIISCIQATNRARTGMQAMLCAYLCPKTVSIAVNGLSWSRVVSHSARGIGFRAQHPSHAGMPPSTKQGRLLYNSDLSHPPARPPRGIHLQTRSPISPPYNYTQLTRSRRMSKQD